MQEIKYDGSESLSEFCQDKEQALDEHMDEMTSRMRKAIENKENASVAVHKLGAVFKSRGKWYRVTETGLQQISWLSARRGHISTKGTGNDD